MPRPLDASIPPRVRDHVSAALRDPTLPLSVRGAADALGVSPQTLYNHQRAAERDGRPRDRVITHIRRGRAFQDRVARRVKRRRGAQADAETIERLRAELAAARDDHARLLEQWVLLETNAKAEGIDVTALLAPAAHRPDRSVNRSAGGWTHKGPRLGEGGLSLV